MTTVYLAPTIGFAFQQFSNGGIPLSLGKIYSYVAGGTTPAATFTTSAGNIQNANPIILDAAGRPPNEIWLDPTVGAYRFDVYDSNDSLIKSYDNISGVYSASQMSFLQAGVGAGLRTVQSKERDIVSVCDFEVSAGVNVSGNGTDEYVGLQRALTAAVVLGAMLWHPATAAGYRSDTTLQATGKVSLAGGPGSKVFTNSNINLLHLTNAAASFSNINTLQFVGPGTGTSTLPGVKVTNVNNMRMDNVRISAFDTGLLFAKGSIAPQSCYLNTLVNCSIISNKTYNIDAEANTNALTMIQCTIGGGPCATGMRLLDSNNLNVSGGDAEGLTACVFDLDSTGTLNAGHLISGFHFEGNTCSQGDVRIGNTSSVIGVSLIGCEYTPGVGNLAAVNAGNGSALMIRGGVLNGGYTGVSFTRIGAVFGSYSIAGVGNWPDSHLINFFAPETSPALTYLPPTTFDSSWAGGARYNLMRYDSGTLVAAKKYFTNLNVSYVTNSGAPGAGSRSYALGAIALNSRTNADSSAIYCNGFLEMESSNVCEGESATAPVIVNGDTITTFLTGTSRVAPGGAVTGIIMQAGLRKGQQCTVVNQSASSITMAASGTSNVATGVSCVIAALSAARFSWNSVTNLWYQV